MQNEKLGVLDFETDPFVIGRIPYPFAAGIWFGQQPDDDYGGRILWEPRIVEKTIAALRRLNTCTLYAHNGGKFDFHFLVENADPQEIQIRNGRITQMRIGKVTLKDSWPLMPFPLEEYRKTKINYDIFEKDRRNIPANRKRIESYLIDDCRFLLELIQGFRAVIGPKDTIGSAAFYQMKENGIDIKHTNEPHDDLFRQYYFGGRCETLKKGVFSGRFLYLDINSAYPYAMKFRHPTGQNYLCGDRLPPFKHLGPCFIHCIADSKNALPLREKEGLYFPHVRDQEFYATGWEIIAGLKTKTLTIKKIIEAWIPTQFICFSEYIDKFFALRQQAKKDDDKIKRLAYKYLLNAGYGKFAQNPREFKKYRLAPYGETVNDFDWEIDFGGISLWSKSSYNGTGFYDVATGASITGFVRAMLWNAICDSKNVLYADTDSLLCSSSSVKLGEELGEWKLEGKIRRAAIAGKKLYGVEWTEKQDNSKYKIASKGARLEFRDIVSLCNGKTIEWENKAPTFSASNPPNWKHSEKNFVTRRITKT